MGQMRAAPAPIRASLAMLAGLLLALRLLSPAGFMPAFEHGVVTIVACPDYEPAAPAPMMHDHHHGQHQLHQPCPFAAGAASTTHDGWGALLAAAILFGQALLFGRAFRFLASHRSRERPPLRGPPIPA